ncbi:peptidyl-prolyl cis-trans isomerase G-like isoform X1 [Homarus americanus]|uniref:peptidyl-prolyl cis-trans isomerase G-like isoform X1 n=1 Tax=Homarus americanus TaxID=6706 RepID=UPI001C476E8E|nr:peptidyl-prolyl cis-trans isomerase G-like isoform X1 [Homarus americanus]
MTHRVRCFFDIEIDGIPSGRIIFELYNDVCPKTCENFRALCTGEMGEGKTTTKPLHYRGVKFHRVIKDFMIQAGDFSAGNGTGGESIYGGQFEDETFEVDHSEPFLLSMANRGKDTNGSQFFITTQPSTHLDGKHVVFGRVVSGQEVVVAVENLPVDNRSRPLQPSVIANCGELVLQRSIKPKEKKRKKKKENIPSSDSESDSEKKKKKKKKKKEKKQKHKKAESSGEEGEVKDDTSEGGDQAKFQSHPLISVSVINPDEIPDVPKNRFLYRAGPEKDGENEGRQDRGRERSRATVRAYTKSGRKVKGRGSLRYHTPSPSQSRSRSRTPPHWRQAQRRTISYDQLQKWNEEKMRREEDRQMRQDEREQEIEERRRRREQRHREIEESGGKDNENVKRDQFQREPGMKGDWRDPRDKMRRDFREGRNQQVWRNGRDRQRGGDQDWRDARERTRTEEDWREGRNKDQWNDRGEEFGHQDLREKLRSQREKLESVVNDNSSRPQRDDQDSDDEQKIRKEKNIKKEKQSDLKEKHDVGKRDKQDDFDETALDYEVMDNEDEEEEEDEVNKPKTVNGRVNEAERSGRNPSPRAEENGELKEEKLSEEKDIKKEKELDHKKVSRELKGRSRSHEGKGKDRSRSHERHKDRSRDRRGRSRDRRDRSRDRRNRSRDRRNGSRDRRGRSRERNSRRDRSRDRRERSRDRRSRSRDKGRERRRHRSDTSSSDSD